MGSDLLSFVLEWLIIVYNSTWYKTVHFEVSNAHEEPQQHESICVASIFIIKRRTGKKGKEIEKDRL
jgi:hypothetical protein